MQDRILKSEKINWKQIQTLQPDNFKLPEQQEVLKKSLLANGFVSPFCVWQDPEGVIWSIDGVHRIKALTELQEQGQDIPQLLTANFIEAKDRKEAGIILLEVFNTKQNKATEQGLELLKIDLNISNDDLHVDFTDLDIKIELEDPEITELETAEALDEAPEPPTIPITAKGDLYELNGHRVLCGDSLLIDDIDKLMQGARADLASNDPPYGMKKENEGVANDNLNFDDLLQFNHDWITLQFSSVLKDNGSWYCWGIDEPLMDIYSNIIKPLIKAQKATFRELLTWNKGDAGAGGVSFIGKDGMRSYPKADEKCLFVMCGVQHYSESSTSPNSDNYFEGWDSIRLYLVQEKEKLGLTNKELTKHLNTYHTHYWTTSQWVFPTEEHYTKLQELGKVNNNDAFKKEYEELKKEYEEIKKEFYSTAKIKLDAERHKWQSTRAYFDNTHDNMTNVWDIGRTKGAERAETGGHATPKPLELCQRVIKSSCPQDGLVVDAFLGSGSTLIAAEQTNRRCYGIELEEKYCDVIVTRWVKMMQSNNKEYVVKRNGEVIQWEIE